MIKHEKNQIDEQNLFENSQKNLLSLMNKNDN